MQRPRAPIEKSSSKSSRNNPISPAALPNEAATAGLHHGDEYAEPWIRLGSIARARGLAGDVVFDVHHSVIDTVQPGLVVKLVGRAGSMLTRVTRVRPLKDRIVVNVSDVGDRSDAEKWVGADVVVTRQDLGACQEGEYFHYELLGDEVVDEDGTVLGRVVDVVSSPANDVIVGRGASGEFLIPATIHAVLGVDRARKQIRVDPRALVYSDDKAPE